MKQVSVAVLTYRRPDHMVELLPLLHEQRQHVEGPDYRVRIVVVDNDPHGGARKVVEELAQLGPVHYVNERVPGIAAARNRALIESETDDILVFIDDDERPETAWLAALLSAYEYYDSAAIAAPVLAVFDHELPTWVREGGFFERSMHRTGDTLQSAATGNLLLDLHRVRRLGLSFDPRFGLSGGEDSLFTRRLTMGGEEIRWTADAVVTEITPPERTTRRWVLERALRNGNSWSRVRIEVADSVSARIALRLRYGVRGAARVVRSSARFLAAGARGDLGARASATGEVAGGFGLLLGALAIHTHGYRRPRAAMRSRR